MLCQGPLLDTRRWASANIMCIQAGLQVLGGAGGRAGRRAGATSMASPGGQGPTLATSAKQLKASPSLQDQLSCSPSASPAEEATPTQHFQNASTPPFPPQGSSPCLGHFHLSPTSPRGIFSVKGINFNFFLPI